MNAVHVLRCRLRVLHLVLLSQSRIGVASGTGIGKVKLEHGRIGMLSRQYLVGAVAVRTPGRAGSSQRMAHTMNARGVLPGRLFMATATIDRLGSHIVVRMLGG